MKSIVNIISSSITGKPELGRVLWALSVIGLTVFQVLAILVNHQPFSPTEFGLGAASILAAGGFGIAAKEKGTAAAQSTGVSQ